MASLKGPMGIDAPRIAQIAERVASLLPPSLASTFEARFTRSDRLFDEYVSRLTFEVVSQAKIDGALASWGTSEEIVTRAGLDARCAVVPVDWMLRRLAARGGAPLGGGAAARRVPATRR